MRKILLGKWVEQSGVVVDDQIKNRKLVEKIRK